MCIRDRLGISRKRFIKDLSGNNDSSLRIGGTISSSIFAMLQGVQMLRVHDVNEVNQAIKVFKALINKKWSILVLMELEGR